MTPSDMFSMLTRAPSLIPEENSCPAPNVAPVCEDADADTVQSLIVDAACYIGDGHMEKFQSTVHMIAKALGSGELLALGNAALGQRALKKVQTWSQHDCVKSSLDNLNDVYLELVTNNYLPECWKKVFAAHLSYVDVEIPGFSPDQVSESKTSPSLVPSKTAQGRSQHQSVAPMPRLMPSSKASHKPSIPPSLGSEGHYDVGVLDDSWPQESSGNLSDILSAMCSCW
eukprot:CAMPEP_0113940748 /NCGR_PEP_ID=MMETSP1339-20121228/6822_1 /TAXON_ID=94617 /ORGANISM="Fibrocapsa japonica" /LENGTH=227 /DNA_ID=CAMNT_0000944689 /DNA_START=12 /DNA_END=692 /DNA_ORIENTATION=- /assembly_acc=CAM_ASM_000762